MLTRRTPKVTGGIPAPVDHTIEVVGRQTSEHGRGAALDLVQVGEQHLRALRPDGLDLPGAVAVARVGRVGLEPETARPVPARPDLLGAEQLGDVVVLHPGQVPHEPPDRVGTRFGGPADLLLVESVHGAGRQWWDAVVDLEQQRRSIHGLHLMQRVRRTGLSRRGPPGGADNAGSRDRRLRCLRRSRCRATECRSGPPRCRRPKPRRWMSSPAPSANPRSWRRSGRGPC